MATEMTIIAASEGGYYVYRYLHNNPSHLCNPPVAAFSTLAEAIEFIRKAMSP